MDAYSPDILGSDVQLNYQQVASNVESIQVKRNVQNDQHVKS